MRRLGLCVAVLATLLAASADGAQMSELRLGFPGLSGGGQVSVAVFASGEAWRRRTGAVWSTVVPVGAGGVTVTRELPPGEYAVMAYHDRNANGRLDTLPVGLPTEPYGFSNNSRGVFGPPGWRAAAFRLGPGRTDQVIRLR